MEGMAQRIEAAVAARRADLVALTADLIRIESVTGSEGPIQEYIAARLRRMALEVDVFEPDLTALARHPAFHPVKGLDYRGRPNVVATWKGGDGRSLILNGHVDTIPVQPANAWSKPPFSGAEQADAVHGRGASDMKGGLAAMTMAIQVLQDLGIQPGGDVILQYVVDEELTGYGTLAAIQRGYRADAGICLETSDLAVQPACVGRLWFTLTVRGQAVSVTRHWEGVSAIDKGILFVAAFKALELARRTQLSHPLYPDNRIALPCAVFMFESGSFPSAVPDRAILRGSLGLLPHERVEDVKRAVAEQVRRVAEADPWLRQNPPELTFKDVGADGAEIPPDHPIVRCVAAAYEQATGERPEISGRVGGADTRYLIKHGGTPTVIFGPGMSAQMHAVDESVPVSYLETATKVVALSIMDWCGVRQAGVMETPDAG